MSNPNHHPNSDTRHRSPPPKPHPKLLLILLRFILMSLILSFFLIFLGLAAIFLLHLLATSFLHRRRQQHTTPPTATSSYSFLDLQTHLPPFRYLAAAASDDCSICLERFKEGDICRSLPVCDHIFHAHCVDSWLTKVPSCPFCRTLVRLEVDRLSDSIVGDDDRKSLWASGVGRQLGVN